ncbi:MAG: transglutaminase domain-containing protein [Clostridia bacterium]
MFLGFFKNADYSNPSVYLKQGEQTKFIFNETDLKSFKQELGEIKLDKDLFKIITYINLKKNYSSKRKFEKFSRTAKEIFLSGDYSGGCTDYALVFETIARQLGIPTIHVQLADLDWIEDLNSGLNGVRGHHICECYINNKWVCVDVVENNINGIYEKESLIVGNRKCFAKSLDVFETGIHSLEENNRIMKKLFLRNNN